MDDDEGEMVLREQEAWMRGRVSCARPNASAAGPQQSHKLSLRGGQPSLADRLEPREEGLVLQGGPLRVPDGSASAAGRERGERRLAVNGEPAEEPDQVGPPRSAPRGAAAEEPGARAHGFRGALWHSTFSRCRRRGG